MAKRSATETLSSKSRQKVRARIVRTPMCGSFVVAVPIMDDKAFLESKPKHVLDSPRRGLQEQKAVFVFRRHVVDRFRNVLVAPLNSSAAAVYSFCDVQRQCSSPVALTRTTGAIAQLLAEDEQRDVFVATLDGEARDWVARVMCHFWIVGPIIDYEARARQHGFPRALLFLDYLAVLFNELMDLILVPIFEEAWLLLFVHSEYMLDVRPYWLPCVICESVRGEHVDSIETFAEKSVAY